MRDVARRGWRWQPGLLALGLALPACSTPRGTAERPAVTRFDIQGTREVSADDIREHLATQPSDGFWALFWRRTRYLDTDAFETDLKRIVRYYQARGHYTARVEEAEVRPDGEGRVALEVRVEEGPATRVSEIDVEGAEAAPAALARLGELPLHRGAVFTEPAYDATTAAVREALSANGYAEATVTPLARVDPVRAEARITYRIEPGRQYRVGNLFVVGAAQVPRERVREQVELVLEPGQIFDETLLPRAQGRVFDLGVFGGVRLTPGTPDPERGTIPVVIAVREAPFRTIRLGPTFVAEATSAWKAGLLASWTHRNWLGGLRRLHLEARGGWAWLPTPFSPEKQGLFGVASARLAQPAFAARWLDLTAALEIERGLEQAYSFDAVRTQLGLPVRPSRALTLTPSYNLEVYRIRGDVSAVDVGQGGGLAIVRSCGGNPCVLSYLEQRLTLDLRDDPLDTRRGLLVSLSLQEGFRIGDFGFPYLRLLPEVRGFVPLGAPILALRARVGLVHPLSEQPTPVVALLASGGPTAMRGYYTSRLAPVTELPNGTFAPVGGNGLVDGSAELRFPMVSQFLGAGDLWGVAFVDAGNVEVAARDVFSLRSLQWAVGLGLRLKTPVGPIRLDAGFRLPRRSGGAWVWPTVPLVQIGPRGELVPAGSGERLETTKWAFHFSLGEAF